MDSTFLASHAEVEAPATARAAAEAAAEAAAAGAQLAALQAARLPLAMQRAAAKIRGLAPDAAAQRLVHASQRARSVTQRVVWLHKAASAWGQSIKAIAACRQGCAHCCQIPVTISSREAGLIARTTGRAARVPVDGVRMQALLDADESASASETLQRHGKSNHAGSACPFLRDSACTIYAVRPLACRVLFNLDDDELLCRHNGLGPMDVPYADSRMLRALALAAQPAELLADIRAFFPKGS